MEINKINEFFNTSKLEEISTLSYTKTLNSINKVYKNIIYYT